MWLLRFHAEAEKEYFDSALWYEMKQKGLGEKFLTTVRAKLEEIVLHPNRYPKKKGKFWEAIVEVFPFILVYYADNKNKIILITAVFHTSRNPSLKYRK